MMGGTPLNNEVWRLTNITKIPRIAPLTRSTYVPCDTGGEPACTQCSLLFLSL